MTNKLSLFALIIACLALWVAETHKGGEAAQTKKETAFERVMRTRSLSCSYAPLSPFLTIDPASGQIGGLMREVMEEVGRRLDIKVKWAEEVGYGQISTGFATGRYDAFCGVLYATPARGGAMTFSRPIYYNKVHPCVRENTTEYDHSVETLNAPDKTFIAYDGDISMRVAQTLFPKAKILALSENTPFGEAMQNILTKKADSLATCDQIIVNDLNKANPGFLKIADPDHPITTIQVALGLPLQDEALKNMIDLALFDMQADGTMTRLATRYVGAERMKDTIVIPSVSKGEK